MLKTKISIGKSPIMVYLFMTTYTDPDMEEKFVKIILKKTVKERFNV